MITPALQDDAFLDDLRAAAAEREHLHVWWLGQSGFLLQWNGEHLLFDPYLSDSLTHKYASTDRPHVRMTERVIDPARLDMVAIVTSTHMHTDHCDAETLGPIFAASPQARLVLPAANVDVAVQRLGATVWPRFVPLADGERTTAGAFTIEAVPAAHEELAPTYAGFVVSAGPHRIYHSGDTMMFPGMVERMLPFAVSLALLPINGRSPERRVAGNLDGLEAARLAYAIHARWAVPCHYEMFEFNTASPDPFRAECERLGQRCAVLQAGERWTLG